MPKIIKDAEKVRLVSEVDRSLQKRVDNISRITGLKKKKLMGMLLEIGIEKYEAEIGIRDGKIQR